MTFAPNSKYSEYNTSTVFKDGENLQRATYNYTLSDGWTPISYDENRTTVLLENGDLKQRATVTYNLSTNGGGSGGATNYNELTNKPQINSVGLVGNKTLESLGIQPAGGYASTDSLNTKADKATTLEGYGITDAYTKTEVDGKFNNIVTAYGLKINKDITQAVNNGTTYDLLSDVNLSTDVTLEANKQKTEYNLTTGALKLPNMQKYVDYSIEVRLNGTFAGGEGTNREFSIQLQRADGTIISEKAVVKVSGNDLSKRSVVFETYTNGSSDPFIANGLKIIVNNQSGQTLNLTNKDVLIKARY